MMAMDRGVPDFHADYLKAIAALQALGDALVPIGMSGCREFERLQSEIVKHGATTQRIIEREAIEAAEPPL